MLRRQSRSHRNDPQHVGIRQHSGLAGCRSIPRSLITPWMRCAPRHWVAVISKTAGRWRVASAVGCSATTPRGPMGDYPATLAAPAAARRWHATVQSHLPHAGKLMVAGTTPATRGSHAPGRSQRQMTQMQPMARLPHGQCPGCCRRVGQPPGRAIRIAALSSAHHHPLPMPARPQDRILSQAGGRGGRWVNAAACPSTVRTIPRRMTGPVVVGLAIAGPRSRRACTPRVNNAPAAHGPPRRATSSRGPIRAADPSSGQARPKGLADLTADRTKVAAPA